MELGGKTGYYGTRKDRKRKRRKEEGLRGHGKKMGEVATDLSPGSEQKEHIIYHNLVYRGQTGAGILHHHNSRGFRLLMLPATAGAIGS